jgi:glutathione S-transferase
VVIGFGNHAIWGSELSPYSLKLRALCDAAGLAYRWLPAEGGRWEVTRAALRLEWAKRRRRVRRYPAMTALDEYPLVPYLFTEAGIFYDSSSLARWLDDGHRPAAGPLVPEDPALAFVAQVLDEAFDEFGLYLVHHQRWVVSARRNDAGERVAAEFALLLPPGLGPRFAERFARRQVRRLPYLFSVAAPGLTLDGVTRERTPPARAGFPPTHALLEESWAEYVGAVEEVLAAQPYLLGGRFTLADASAYGCLGMNLKDPETAERLRARAPSTDRWLRAIRDGDAPRASGALVLSPLLRRLLAIVARTFVPLMRRNDAAYEAARGRGETLFNEPAFDRGRALYDGELLGHPFRAVVKTFQVQVWRDLRATWDGLSPAARARVAELFSGNDPGAWFAAD